MWFQFWGGEKQPQVEVVRPTLQKIVARAWKTGVEIWEPLKCEGSLRFFPPSSFQRWISIPGYTELSISFMGASSFIFTTALQPLQQLSPYSSLRIWLIFSLFFGLKLNFSPLEDGGRNSRAAGLGLMLGPGKLHWPFVSSCGLLSVCKLVGKKTPK